MLPSTIFSILNYKRLTNKYFPIRVKGWLIFWVLTFHSQMQSSPSSPVVPSQPDSVSFWRSLPMTCWTTSGCSRRTWLLAVSGSAQNPIPINVNNDRVLFHFRYENTFYHVNIIVLWNMKKKKSPEKKIALQIHH